MYIDLWIKMEWKNNTRGPYIRKYGIQNDPQIKVMISMNVIFLTALSLWKKIIMTKVKKEISVSVKIVNEKWALDNLVLDSCLEDLQIYPKKRFNL